MATKNLFCWARTVVPILFLALFILLCCPAGATPPENYIAQDIGGTGQTLATTDGYDVTARGGEIGAATDSFHFGHQQRTGNFDVRARIAGITVTDAFMQAGLMARETLNADGRFAGAFASSPQMGAFFEARSTVAVKATNSGGFPANYPHMWLRLQRSANQFTSFASLDGESWSQLGTVSLPLPQTIFFGLAVTSANTNAPTKVQFRDVGDVTSGSVVPLKYSRERLGPSSRRTGLAFSEIMYHPPDRADLRNLEFVELYNGGSIFEDLGGMRIAGAIDFVFPPRTRLEAGAFIVVAKAPGDMQAVHALGSVLGPYGGALPNDLGAVVLHDARGHVLLEANYSGERGWPAAADGAGSSLVLARPSYGGADARAWEASTFIGGSPGSTDPVVPILEQNIVINEFLAHTDAPQLDFIELYNHGNEEVDLSGFWLSDEANTNKFRIPDNTRVPARGYISFEQSMLGFALSADGEQIFLVNSNKTRVIDGLKFPPQENGVSSGRWPDGANAIRRLSNVTQAAANSRWRASDIVINEVMYAPISGDSDDEYVELYNNGPQTVNLKDWRITGGIDYKFPASASIPAGGYVVIARNLARMRANYPQLNANNAFGDFDGSLKNSSERLALAMPDQVLTTNSFDQVIASTIYIEVSEVTYADGGRWSQWADGGGSSLELIDSRADTTQADSWRESDETAKAPWSTVEVTGILDNGQSAYLPANQLQITLQGAGECLVDQVEVIEAGLNYVVTNADFENGTTGWVFQGNHGGTTVATSGAFQGTRALHIRAPGRGDTGLNRIRTALTVNAAAGRTLAANDTVTIRAKVRWLKGWPEILLRLRGGWLDCPGKMAIPANLGTPGQANSRRILNAGPAIYEIVHTPAVPAANQTVVVTARVSDPDGIGGVNLRYRVDPSTTVQTALMRDDGALGDAVAGDGLYSALLTGRAAGNVVAFRVEATDPSSASTVYPNDAPARECIIRWGDQVRFGTFATYFMWSTGKTATDWGGSDDKNNTYRDVTFVYNGERVVYNASVKDKGSPFHSGGGDALIVMPEDQKVLGATDFAICSSGNGGNEPTSQREQIIMWIAREMGANYLNRRSVHFIYNGSSFRGRNLMEDSEEPNGDYAQASVPGGDGGDLYKVEDWFEFDDSAGSFNYRDADLQVVTTTGGAYDLARYRWMWRKRAVEDSANNYTNLFDLIAAANNVGGTSADYVPRVENLVNVRGWMSVFALQRIAGNWDSYGMNRGKNAYIYKGNGVRWEMFPWDIDFVLGNGSNGATDGLWGGIEPVINRMFNEVAFRRMLWQAYYEAVTGPLLPENYLPQVNERYRVFVANGISGVSAPSASTPVSINTYINQRRAKIVADLATANTPALAITSNSGNDFSTNRAVLTLTGKAPISVYSIEVNGVPYAVKWSTVTDWSMAIPLASARTTFNLSARDRLGNLISGLSDSITVTYTGTLYKPEDYVIINEIMYNPVLPGASFVEIFNRSTLASFDLSDYQVDGIGFVFPEGATISPNGYLVIAQDLAGFAAAYGPNIPVIGGFLGSLDNGGERLKLIKPGLTPDQDAMIDEVRYDDDLPWPLAADGFGPSLQLIDASQDNWPPANWSVTATNAVNRATPGKPNAQQAALSPFPKIYINEVLPNNVSGLADRFGEKEPWIELVNSGTTTLDLSGYYLSDDYTNLAKWQFPAGVSLGAGEFLMIWADGEAAESIASELHTNFRLNPATGKLAISRIQGSQPAVVDHISYTLLSAGRSYGSYPDGQPQNRRVFHFPTHKTTNDPTSTAITVFINEWQAGNNQIVDPSDGDFDDWIELFNAGSETVDLSGYTITDALTNSTKYVIPNGKVLSAGGYLLVWADEEMAQNGFGPDVHANFKLSSGGEQIGLFSPDGSIVDSLTFGAQTDDLSEGRASDGESAPFVTFGIPSPGAANIVSSGNLPPILTAIGNKAGTEGVILAFGAQATDPNDGQSLRYSLVNAPAGASIDSISGSFTWTPSEAQGPGSYPIGVRVTDDGSPPRSVTETIRVDVAEANRAPTLFNIASVSIDEGVSFSVEVSASDPDLPTNRMAFSLEIGSPAGLQIHPATGQISWIPSEEQGPGDHPVTVRVTDDGVPPMSASASFILHVNEANNQPLLDPILPVSIDEGQTLTINARALDQDNPPAGIIYSLEGSIPNGASIDPASGVLNWVTTELAGPSTNFLTVRATENNTERLSDSRNFSVIVREVNQAPTLSGIPVQFTSDDGSFILLVQARDDDLPGQILTYELLAGSPPGATIDSKTGMIQWNVPLDEPAGTNSISVKVTDNGPGFLSATATFDLVVRPAVRIVINEIMRFPAALNGEYVELHNTSAARSWNVSGWKLEGDGLSFMFPENSIVPPGGYLLVVQNRAVFNATYGSTWPIAGEWTGALLSKNTLRLLNGDVAVDVVSFEDSAPWPAIAAGTSLQVIDARQDNNRLANWQSAAGYSGPTNLVVMTNSWRFDQGGTDLGAAWRASGYSDTSWLGGLGLLYVESATLPGPKNTLLTLGPSTYYFRTKFTLPARPLGAQLVLNTILDDGAIFYLNGVEIHRMGVPVGPVTHATFANVTVGDAVSQGPFTLSGDALIAGENVLAVEVHQVNATSSDIVFGCSLNLLGGQVASHTPGAVNSIAATIPSFAPLFLNEVLAINAAGVADSAGDRDPWVELYNAGSLTLPLQGLYLTDNFRSLTRWPFPDESSIAPGEYKTVWLDGETGESTDLELHAGFRLSTNGALAITRLQNGEPAILDYIKIANLPADQSFGSFPNGQLDDRLLMMPTPSGPNARSVPAQRPSVAASFTGGKCVLNWNCENGRRYRVLYQDTLGAQWQLLFEGIASGSTASFTDEVPVATHRFYKIEALP